MGILLYFVFTILGLIAVVFILALFTQKEYSIQRETTINQPISLVFSYIKHLKNQDNYSKWVMTDPSMKRVFTGEDGTEGFIYTWDSTNKQAGAGEQEIIELSENKHVDIEVRFIRPFKAIAKTPFTLKKIDEHSTNIVWNMKSSMNYPMNIILLFMNADKMLGKDMEISLENLKKILEKKAS
jgi:hypothetical protein